MDLSESINILKGVPDQALQHELVQPSGMVPGYLVLAEAQRRQLLRQAEQKQQGQQSGSVYDDVIRNMMARQPPQGLPPAPPGMTPTPNAPPSGALGSTPPQNFQAPRGMAEGGEVDDEADDTPVMSPTGSASRSMEDSDWEPIIQRAAKDNNLDPALIRAMIQRESGGNRKALSPKGALGPMQLMPATAKELGVTDRTDPAQAIPAGAHYLREHLDKYGDLDKALAAYNAGPGAVDQYGGVPPYKETRDYIKAIKGNLDSQQSTFLGPGRPDLLPSGPVGMLDDQGNEVPLTPQPPADQPAPSAAPPQPQLPAGPTLPLPTPDSSGLAAVLSSAGPGPAPPSPTAAAPAQIPSFHQPTMDEMMAQARKLYGPPPQDPVLRAELGRLEAQAQRLRKPDIWGTLAALGSGMASSTSPFWGQALGAGAAAVLKNENVRQEQARQLELATMGISEKLDDRAQQYQRGLAEVGMKAQGQYEQHQLAAYNAAAKIPGAIAGKESDQALHPGFEFVAHPYADTGIFVPPGSRKVTADIQPFLPFNQATGKPYQVGDDVSYNLAVGADKAAQSSTLAKAKQKPTVAGARIASAVDQFYNNHPELPRPANSDGSPKDPTGYALTDVPPQYQPEANYNAQVLSGMTRAKAEALVVDPKSSPEMRQLGQSFLSQEAKQTGAVTTARVTATNLVQESMLTPQALDLMSEQALSPQGFTNRNPLIVAKAYDAAAQKAKDRGLTATGVLMERNAAKAAQSALVDITKLNTNAEAFSKTAEKSMEVLETQAQKVSDLGAPIFNTPLREFQRRWAGNADVAGFRAALLPAQAEIARVLNSPGATGGVLSDSARHEMELAIGEDATYAQIHRALDVFRTDMANKRDVYAQQMGEMKAKTVVGGAAQPAGATRTATDPKTGRKAISKDGGKTWVWQDTGERVQ